ncbi:hypothetical protein [Amycolatopsis sp. cmx-8-4]|uniref:hypothetical protein n=1 Tax=Amycolatopsis sp. cmx-8-4 TaxID=2790947 RepID=UPI00397C5A92
MKNTLFATGAAAAFLVLTPAAALAATSTPEHPEHPDGPMTRITRQLTVLPGRAAPGALVKVDFACRTRGPGEQVSVTAAAIAYETGGKTAKVNQVKPGKYAVTLHCGPEKSTAYLEVLGARKQVAKVPAGAPQTGGTDGPADGAPTGPPAAAGAMGILALGGSGLVLARRSRRD